jgi:hypothetical protein
LPVRTRTSHEEREGDQGGAAIDFFEHSVFFMDESFPAVASLDVCHAAS